VLDSPASEDEIYLARAGEVDPYRPICQGDIFGNVEIPGLAGGPARWCSVTHVQCAQGQGCEPA
jgi:hypothetical protein